MHDRKYLISVATSDSFIKKIVFKNLFYQCGVTISSNSIGDVVIPLCTSGSEALAYALYKLRSHDDIRRELEGMKNKHQGCE